MLKIVEVNYIDPVKFPSQQDIDKVAKEMIQRLGEHDTHIMLLWVTKLLHQI